MKRIFVVCLFICLHQLTDGQTMKLNDILDSVEQSYPSLKMYDAEIQSLDAAARGAHNWMAPEISTGFWMTPYNANLWENSGPGTTGMGQYMISVEQTFPNRKYNAANEKFMRAMSSVEILKIKKQT